MREKTETDAALPIFSIFATLVAAGCSDPCCTYDSRPIRLVRAAAGELLALVASESGESPLPAVVDTATPISLWAQVPALGTPEVTERTVRIFGAGGDPGPPPLRAVFRHVKTVGAALGDIGAAAGPLHPRGLLGGDFLVGFSVAFAFEAPEVTFFSALPATDPFLSASGYAVLRTERRGGGELDARAPRDGIGPRGPYQYPASLLLLRACAAPAAFVREAALPASCCRGDERRLATGVDLQLVLATGVGPIVLGRSAWLRVREQWASPPPTRRAPLLIATSLQPIDAEWTTLPRLALVDREAAAAVDPGACVELGRTRRLEQVAADQALDPESAACALPCDEDAGSGGLAQNSAAYVELGPSLDVAIVEDREPLLQSLRNEARPEGPEVAGLIGAGALRSARVEIDYISQPARLNFSCEVGAPADTCRAVGRCPRLSGGNQRRACFGLPPHGLPRICDNPPVSCQ